MQPPKKKRRTENIITDDINEDEYEIDGFIVSDDDLIQITRKKRHKNRNRNKSYKYPKITEETKRMIYTINNKKYIPNIDIDQGISDIDNIQFNSDSDHSNHSHSINKQRKLKRKIIDIFDSDNTSDDQVNYLNETNNNNTNNNFIVNDIIYPIQKHQIQTTFEYQKLYQIFGNKIYLFLDIPMPNDYFNNCDSDMDINHSKQQNKYTLKKPVKSLKKSSKFSIKLPKRKVLNNKSLISKSKLDMNLTTKWAWSDMIESNKSSVYVNDNNNLIYRQISYSLFHNITQKEAENKLFGNNCYGNVIFRPSIKGLNYLEMTWNMHSNIFVNWIIIEKNKPYPNAIGTKLIINKQIYDDLDEIYCNFIQILNRYVNNLIESKYFKYGNKNDIKIMLKEEINVSNKGCYAISFSFKYFGYCLLSYIGKKGVNIKREYIKITSKGYEFRNKMFETPSDLINDWKRQEQKKYLENKKNKSKKSKE